MPILAAPLVIPFAEAVGISIATLGMAKAADMVNDYIQENPEQSIKILSTIVPGVGIGEIFMKKGKDEEVEEEVEVEDVDARDLTRAEKAKMMKELAKSGGGNMREKMKKGYEEIIQPGESDRELDDAEDRYDGGLEEVSKPKFDYKKFFKKRYADGGAIGIEVLFEEKNPRQGLFMGGSPLTGQALQTYNSMKAYGFSDQEIADALSLQRASASNAETATAATAAPINIYNQLGGGGNGPDDDDDGPTSNAGLKGFDAVRTAGLFALNPVGYLASKALTGLYNNYKNPYTNVLGVTNAATKAAITREETRDLQDRIDRGDFGSNTPTPQDKGRTDKGGKGSGSSDGSKGSRGGGMGGFGGGADRD